MENNKNLYFRVRDNGAAVFRLNTQNRQQRMEFKQIATLNLHKAEIKPQSGTPPTESEIAQIDAWIVKRRKIVADRQIEDIKLSIEHLNATAQWIQSKASQDQINEFADELLVAMHDLRMVIVRKKSDALENDNK